MSIPRLIHRTTSQSQAALLFLLPHGGQNLARRNAWTAMAVDAARARARRDAATAMAHATSQRQCIDPVHRMAANA